MSAATIELVPVGDVPVVLLEGLSPVVEARFPGRRARIGARRPPPDDAFAPSRRQYRAEPILGVLGQPGPERRLGVADLDLYAPGLNLVFGQAQPGGPAAVMALARLRPEFWGSRPIPSSCARVRRRRPCTSWRTPMGSATAGMRPA